MYSVLPCILVTNLAESVRIKTLEEDQVIIPSAKSGCVIVIVENEYHFH